MPARDAFVEEVLELLEPLGLVVPRRLFGGWGLYLDGSMFGLIADGRLYLKTDATNRAAFEAAGCEPFVYDPGTGRKPVAMCYWTPPAEAADDALALLPWARRAVEAAARARAAKAKPKVSPERRAPSGKKAATSGRGGKRGGQSLSRSRPTSR